MGSLEPRASKIGLDAPLVQEARRRRSPEWPVFPLQLMMEAIADAPKFHADGQDFENTFTAWISKIQR
jgi:hypothetical protein